MMDSESLKFWNSVYAAPDCDSDKLIDALRWRGSRAYIVVEIAGYTRSLPISKDAARSILKDAAYVRALEYKSGVYLIAEGVEKPPAPQKTE